MSRRVITIAALALFFFAAAVNGQEAPSTTDLIACGSNSDCASATCCDVTVCVNKQFAPTENTCHTVPCLQTPGPITTCECSAAGSCRTVSQAVVVAGPATGEPAPGVPAPVFTQPADLLMQCSADGDCGMQTCCESKLCLNNRYAAQCGNVTAEHCPNDQLDCKCMNNRCGKAVTQAPQTTSSGPSSTQANSPKNDSNADVNVNNNNSGAIAASLSTVLISALVAVVFGKL